MDMLALAPYSKLSRTVCFTLGRTPHFFWDVTRHLMRSPSLFKSRSQGLCVGHATHRWRAHFLQAAKQSPDSYAEYTGGVFSKASTIGDHVERDKCLDTRMITIFVMVLIRMFSNMQFVSNERQHQLRNNEYHNSRYNTQGRHVQHVP